MNTTDNQNLDSFSNTTKDQWKEIIEEFQESDEESSEQQQNDNQNQNEQLSQESDDQIEKHSEQQQSMSIKSKNVEKYQLKVQTDLAASESIQDNIYSPNQFAIISPVNNDQNIVKAFDSVMQKNFEEEMRYKQEQEKQQNEIQQEIQQNEYINLQQRNKSTLSAQLDQQSKIVEDSSLIIADATISSSLPIGGETEDPDQKQLSIRSTSSQIRVQQPQQERVRHQHRRTLSSKKTNSISSSNIQEQLKLLQQKQAGQNNQIYDQKPEKLKYLNLQNVHNLTEKDIDDLMHYIDVQDRQMISFQCKQAQFTTKNKKKIQFDEDYNFSSLVVTIFHNQFLCCQKDTKFLFKKYSLSNNTITLFNESGQLQLEFDDIQFKQVILTIKMLNQ